MNFLFFVKFVFFLKRYCFRSVFDYFLKSQKAHARSSSKSLFKDEKLLKWYLLAFISRHLFFQNRKNIVFVNQWNQISKIIPLTLRGGVRLEMAQKSLLKKHAFCVLPSDRTQKSYYVTIFLKKYTFPNDPPPDYLLPISGGGVLVFSHMGGK